MKIRAAQFEALEEVPAGYDLELARHIESFAPAHAEVLGIDGTRQVSALGLERAAAHGFTRRSTVRFYVELMFLLGSDFDTDPQYPWVRRALNDDSIRDELARADRLWFDLRSYLARVAGPDQSYVRRALKRARQEDFEGLPVSGRDSRDAMLARLHRVFPEKAECLGSSALEALLAHGVALAQSHDMSRGRGTALFVGLAFALGHGFPRDPQFPWIENTLQRGGTHDPERRARRLHSKAMTYLDNVLLKLEEA